ncbi:hypothetical protein LF1_10760 [Rubripirellula obstinata]|uniref:Uncharacterized protein n=1 Tax=Rubripirellula obstinata TaxID=406547 RepID=A0A5B1CDA9_9BACT|nr:PEP-CTERM sorting domain-containing protein [Rubripirellula obstinata]KAA1258556.1 hypothetical protein LF1_10760 [Rubripirellula obstinata]
MLNRSTTLATTLLAFLILTSQSPALADIFLSIDLNPNEDGVQDTIDAVPGQNIIASVFMELRNTMLDRPGQTPGDTGLTSYSLDLVFDEFLNRGPDALIFAPPLGAPREQAFLQTPIAPLEPLATFATLNNNFTDDGLRPIAAGSVSNLLTDGASGSIFTFSLSVDDAFTGGPLAISIINPEAFDFLTADSPGNLAGTTGRRSDFVLSGGTINVIPEPSSLAVVFLGSGLIALRRRRRNSL